MSTFAFPSIVPTSTSMGLVANTRIYKSPFTNAVQTIGRQGEYWSMRMMFDAMDSSERADMMAFLVRLNGQEHRFQARDFSYAARGVLTGTPLVNGAAQVGSTLIVDGCTPSITGWARAGDQFQIANELKMITVDANSDGGGNATLQFKPQLRTSPADNAAIIVSQPKGLYMLASQNVEWSTGPGIIYSGFVVEAVEDVLG